MTLEGKKEGRASVMSKFMRYWGGAKPSWLPAVTSQLVTHIPDLDSTPEPWKEPTDGVHSLPRCSDVTQPTQPVRTGWRGMPFYLARVSRHCTRYSRRPRKSHRGHSGRPPLSSAGSVPVWELLLGTSRRDLVKHPDPGNK